MTTSAFQGFQGMAISQDKQGRLSFSQPITCLMCHSTMSILHDTLTFKEPSRG